MSDPPTEPDWEHMCRCYLGGEHLPEDQQGIPCGPNEALEEDND